VSPDARIRSPFAAPVLQTLLTVREIAAQLGVSTATVYKLCTRGELRYVRILGSIRVARPDLDAYLGLQSV
jgi:excisionase family DNA binding protein